MGEVKLTSEKLSVVFTGRLHIMCGARSERGKKQVKEQCGENKKMSCELASI